MGVESRISELLRRYVDSPADPQDRRPESWHPNLNHPRPIVSSHARPQPTSPFRKLTARRWSAASLATRDPRRDHDQRAATLRCRGRSPLPVPRRNCRPIGSGKPSTGRHRVSLRSAVFGIMEGLGTVPDRDEGCVSHREVHRNDLLTR